MIQNLRADDTGIVPDRAGHVLYFRCPSGEIGGNGGATQIAP